MRLDPVLLWVLRLGGALLLSSAAAHKLGQPPAFRLALSRYGLLPHWALGPVARGLPLLEAGLAAALLWPATAPAAAIGGAALLALYGGAIAASLARGLRGIDCGCGGPAGDAPLSLGLLLRNALLVPLLAAGALAPSGRGMGWLDALSIGGGVAAFALVYLAAEVAMVNAARLRSFEEDL